MVLGGETAAPYRPQRDLSSPVTLLDVDEALMLAGFGRHQLLLFAVCGLGWSADVGELRLIGFLLRGDTLGWQVTAAEKSALSSVLFIGMFVGAWFWGILADKLGRRFAFSATCLLTLTGGVFSALAQSVAWLGLARLIVGFGLGGNLAVDFSMFLEYLPMSHRGRATVWLTGWSAIGNVWATGLAWGIIPAFGWRPYVALVAAPLVPAVIARCFYDESPRYLLVSGQTARAVSVIRDVARANGNASKLPTNFQLKQPCSTQSAEQRGSIRELFGPTMRKTALALCAAWFLLNFGFYGQAVNLPSFYAARGLSEVDGYVGVFISVSAEIPGVALGALMVDRFGRLKTLGTAMVGCGISLMIFSQCTTEAMLLLTSTTFEFMSSIGWGGLYLYTPESLPTTVRATGLGACSAVSRLAGMVSPAVGQLLVDGDPSVPLLVYAVSYFIGAAVVSRALPLETAGMSLSDMVNDKLTGNTTRKTSHGTTTSASVAETSGLIATSDE